ncbi:MAG: lytic murein transglycosylase [Candidatus Pacebacteria bacterium]|nr:lytic murein transglycosylase [Candidatus Paceibacterota bacterium]
MSFKFKKRFSLLLVLVFIIGGLIYQAPKIMANVVLDSAQADKARLESELARLEIEIAAKQKELDGQKGKSVSLDRDISILKTQIQKSKLNINAKNLLIKKIGGEIDTKVKKIDALSTKIDREKESLAQLIRKERQIDDKSILSLILSRDSISDAYGDIDAFASIKQSIQDSVDEIRGVRVLTQSEKKSLEDKKNQEIDTKVELENAKAKVELSEAEKKTLLSISKNKESEYQKVLAEKAKRKNQILTALFNLRDTSAIPFSRALEFANLSSTKTGVRPAFLLAILTQESSLGKNVGSCNRNESEPTWNKIMPGPIHYQNYLDNNKSCNGAKSPCSYRDDQAAFTKITTELGRPLVGTPLSCPMSGGGWGGGMGPSQFIPDTWQKMKAKIAIALGVSTPDPWNPKDAFMASGIYLKDLGASVGGYTAERNAACRYYSGRSCDTKKPANSFYGDQVMAKAKSIQTNMIDPLQD